MSTLIALFIFSGLVVLQTAVISRIPLIYGTADLVLVALIAWALQERARHIWQWTIIGGLGITIASGLPMGVILTAYLIIVGLALVLRRPIWKAPILVMLIATLLGTFIIHIVTYLVRLILGTRIEIGDAFYLVTLPSTLLNLLIAIPVYLLMRDLANWLNPEEIEV